MSESSPGKGVEVLRDAINALPILSTRYDLDSGTDWIDRAEVLKLLPVNPAVPPSSKEPESSALVDARRLGWWRRFWLTEAHPSTAMLMARSDDELDDAIDAEIKKEGAES